MNAVWGPKVWGLLHRLSFYSNRRDITAAWKSVLRLFSDTIPCALCRKHMKEYLLSNPLIFTNTQEGNKIRETIIVWLHTFHNNVNLRLGKEQFPYELLELTYGQGMHEAALLCRTGRSPSSDVLRAPISDYDTHQRQEMPDAQVSRERRVRQNRVQSCAILWRPQARRLCGCIRGAAMPVRRLHRGL